MNKVKQDKNLATKGQIVELKASETKAVVGGVLLPGELAKH